MARPMFEGERPREAIRAQRGGALRCRQWETVAALARWRFGGSLRGRLVRSAGLGGMSGAQPLAVTFNGGVLLVVEVRRERIERKVREGYCDEMAGDLDDTLKRAEAAVREG